MTDLNLTELERRVADLLHHDAEIAMGSTDTETQYRDFISATKPAAGRRRLRWSIGAVAACAAVVALVLAVLLGGSAHKAEPAVPAVERTPVQVATDFMDAIAAYDQAKAAHNVEIGDGDHLGVSNGNLRIWPVAASGGSASLRDGLAWAKAAGFKVQPKDCVGDRQAEGLTVVRCPFDWYFLGSDRLGQPPYEGEFSIFVRGDRIVGAKESIGWDLGGLVEGRGDGMESWAPFATWLLTAHTSSEAGVIAWRSGVNKRWTPTYTDASLPVWAEYVDEWVASQQ